MFQLSKITENNSMVSEEEYLIFKFYKMKLDINKLVLNNVK